MEKSTVRKLHDAMNKALVQIAKDNGFEFIPGNMSYSELEVTGKVKFVVKGKKAQIEERENSRLAIGPLKVGDKVFLAGRPEEYEIVKFTIMSGAHIRNVKTGKLYRCKQWELSYSTKPLFDKGMDCLECGAKGTVIQTGARRVGPELAMVTYTCTACKHSFKEPID